MSFSEFQKYKDDILKFIDDIDGLEKEIAERFQVLKFRPLDGAHASASFYVQSFWELGIRDNVLRQNSAIIENQKTKINQLQVITRSDRLRRDVLVTVRYLGDSKMTYFVKLVADIPWNESVIQIQKLSPIIGHH